jgi:hypothetical protein
LERGGRGTVGPMARKLAEWCFGWLEAFDDSLLALDDDA